MSLFTPAPTWRTALHALFQYQHRLHGGYPLPPMSVQKGLRTVSRSTSVRLARATACIYCGGPLPTTSEFGDHVVPTHLGGHNSLENWAPSCRSCNASKGAKDLLAWRPSRELDPDVLVIYCRVMYQLLEREGRLDDPAPEYACL